MKIDDLNAALDHRNRLIHLLRLRKSAGSGCRMFLTPDAGDGVAFATKLGQHDMTSVLVSEAVISRIVLVVTGELDRQINDLVNKLGELGVQVNERDLL